LWDLERFSAPHLSPRASFLSGLVIGTRVLAEFGIRGLLQSRRTALSLKALRSLKDSEIGRECLVLATGPSLASLKTGRVLDLKRQGSLKVVAINNYFATDLGRKLVPNYYVLSDPAHRYDNDTDVSTQVWDYLLNKGVERILIPRNWGFAGYPSQLSKKIIGYEDLSLEGFSRSWSPVRPRGYTSLTALKAIAVAGYLGFRSIHLLGVDHSLFRGIQATPDSRLIQHAVHAAGGSSKESVDVTHFYPRGMEDFFYETYYISKQVRIIFGKLPINNISFGSFFDFFEKRDPLQLAVHE